MRIEVVHDVNDEMVKAFGRLLPQLSATARAVDADALRTVLGWQSNRLLVAYVQGEIVGTLTLVVFPIPTGMRAWIEDVVVDESARGHGVGAALTLEAVRLARSAGARTVDLTSRPSRQAANRLYERLGFQLRDSKVYRLVQNETRQDAPGSDGPGDRALPATGWRPVHQPDRHW
ncbi:GNAT family N-acetyltransferase [Actinoplanes sp. NPDC024001]|uniref:GNAT family N-acetyltransferase n=1 Tax=Actinoplanes sp. NPDC024001 TaxID=3154598 RepID=UPI0033D7BDB9